MGCFLKKGVRKLTKVDGVTGAENSRIDEERYTVPKVSTPSQLVFDPFSRMLCTAKMSFLLFQHRCLVECDKDLNCLLEASFKPCIFLCLSAPKQHV